MKTPFLILGLPRSRTSWLSMLLSAGPSYCYHELTADCLDLEEIVERMTVPVEFPGRHEFIGNSDSGNLLIFPELIARLGKETRTLWVNRDATECIQSFSRATELPIGPYIQSMFDHLFDLFAAYADHGMLVDYSDLNEPGRVRAIWAYLTQGKAPFPVDHYNKIRNLNVQPTAGYLQEVARHGRDCVLTRPK